MCKFNQNLFIVWCSIWFVLFKIYNASPVDFMLLDDLIDEPANVPEHDLTYDQRQNGTENIRFRVNGVILAFPSSQSNQAGSAVGNLAANYLLQLAAGAADNDDDDSDYFPFVKNANNENGVTAPSSDKEPNDSSKDDKNKKKVPTKPEPMKENSVKRVVVVKEGVRDEVVEVAPERVNPVVIDEQPKLDVIPVKKVQSRRKNK